MAILPASIQLGLIQYDVFAKRPALAATAAGSLFCATDTGTLYQCQLDAAGARYWMTLSSGGIGVGGLKYLVSNDPTMGAPYATIQSAINAAASAGHFSSVLPAPVFVYPGAGPYIENLSLLPNIHLIGLGGGGGQNTQPEVTVQGDASFSAFFAGSITIENINFTAVASNALFMSGASQVAARIERCWFGSSVAAASLNCGLSNAASTFAILDSRVANSVTTALSCSTIGADLLRTSFVRTAVSPALLLAGAVSDRIVSCDIVGAISKASGSAYLERSTITYTGGSTTIAGSATWTVVDVAGPALTFVNTATVVAVQTQRQHTVSVGASLTVPTDVVRYTSNGDYALPDVKTLVDGLRLTLTMRATKSTNFQPFTLTAAAGQFVGAGTQDWYRMFDGGEVTLQTNFASGRWEIVSEYQGTPYTLAVIASNSGVDTNPGTGGRPVRTFRRACELMVPWTGMGYIDLTSGGTYTDDPAPSTLGPIAIPGPIPGVKGADADVGMPLLVLGAMETSGPAATSVTGATNGSAAPPVAFIVGTIASGAYATDAARTLFPITAPAATGGQYSTPPITRSSAVQVEVAAVTTFSNGTCTPQRPGASLDPTVLLEFVPGSGNTIMFAGVDLGRSAAANGTIVFSGVNCLLMRSRILALQAYIGGAWMVVGTPDPQVAMTVGRPAIAWFAKAAVTALVGQGLGNALNLIPRGGYIKSLNIAGGAGCYAQNAIIDNISNEGTLQLVECCAGTVTTPVLTKNGGNGLLTTCMPLGVVQFDAGGSGALLNVTCNHAATTPGVGDAIYCTASGPVRVTGARGTVTNAGSAGVDAQSGSRVNVTDPNSGTTVTGAGGNAKVGVIAGFQTWANINAGAVANCLDIAAAGSAGSYVGK